MDRPRPKPVEWVASSKGDLRGFPAVVREQVGYALFLAQTGGKHANAKPLRGLGPRVLEVVVRHEANAYRAVYTVRFENAIYVLHAFQKKAKKGIATPLHDVDVVRRRLKVAEDHYRQEYER